MEISKAIKIQTELCSDPGSASKALAKIQAAGVTVLGIGKARVALELSRETVLKIAWQQAGIADNAIEARVFGISAPDLKEHLAPVVETHPEHVNVQARCRPIQYNRDALPVIELLGRHGIIDGIQNLGYLNGKIVCYDYATLGMGKFIDLLEGSDVFLRD